MNFWNHKAIGRLANHATAFASQILLIFHQSTIQKKKNHLNLDDYTLVFEDGFEGDCLNTDIWNPHTAEGIRKGGYWSMDQITVKDSNLIIKTEHHSNGKFGEGWYTAGIDTKGTFERNYGYYECRCILPKGCGMWSAFWLMNQNVHNISRTGIHGTEIDIFESPYYFIGGKKSWKVTSNLHYNGYELQTRYRNVCITRLDNNPYENYNTYGLLWTKDEYIFYINGYETARTKYGGVSKEPEFLILSCEVDGAAAEPTFGWSGFIGKNNTNFTTEFKVDYVKVYQKK